MVLNRKKKDQVNLGFRYLNLIQLTEHRSTLYLQLFRLLGNRSKNLSIIHS